jgi:hypothetical protein
MLGGAGSASAATCPVKGTVTATVAACKTGPVTQGVRWQ